MKRLRLPWNDDRVTYLWPDHPLVLAGFKPLDRVIELLDSNLNIEDISTTLSREFHADKIEVHKYVEQIESTLVSAGIIKQDDSTIHNKKNNEFKIENSLSMATLNITHDCNLKCEHCYANLGENKNQELTVPQIRALVKSLGELIKHQPKLLIISGGEPTLVPDKLKEAVLVARESGLTPRLNTNGILITDDLAEFLALNNVLVQVSIDGIDAKTHALLRNSESSFYQATNAVKKLSNAGCRVRISFTVHSQNIEQIPYMIDYAQSLGAEQIITSSLVLVGRAKIAGLKPINYEQEFNILYETVRNSKGKQFYTRSTLLAETITAIRAGVKFSYCGTGCCTCCIDSDGSLYPCINMMRADYSIGNLILNDINEIWTSSQLLTQLRNLNVDQMNLACSKCDFRYFCGGYCRGETLEAGLSITSPYTRCSSWKKGLTKILDFISETPDLYDFGQGPIGGLHRE